MSTTPASTSSRAPAPPSEAPPRVVTSAALYDGHDAAINLVRRGLVAAGAEVIHLGHNRAAHEIARAAIEEDAGAVAVSSYQGGHEELYPYLRQLLDEEGGRHIAIFGGGGGVIQPDEVERLERTPRLLVRTLPVGFGPLRSGPVDEVQIDVVEVQLGA